MKHLQKDRFRTTAVQKWSQKFVFRVRLSRQKSRTKTSPAFSLDISRTFFRTASYKSLTVDTILEGGWPKVVYKVNVLREAVRKKSEKRRMKTLPATPVQWLEGMA